jgi:hypothetical protein
MAVNETQELAPRKWTAPRHGTILAVFTVTLFVSALLLFGVQPMFAKMVLPKLGGSAAVWSIALVFFQSVLLLGYAYAHVLTTKLRPNTAVVVHLAVFAGALLLLPIAYPAGWEHAPQENLPFWLIGLFAVGVGVPFFAVSANAPLLQYWFSRTGHPHGEDPYFLYGASNIGSFAALLCYPFILEPLLSLGDQSLLWSVGYVLLGALIMCCGAALWRLGASAGRNAPAIAAATAPLARPVAADRLWWIGLAAVPSGLLVGVTAYITTDLAAAPFLWVVPLALFLLTFVITFQRQPILKHKAVLRLHSLAVATFLIAMFTPLNGLYMPVIHLAAFFLSAMVCHGELVRRRPHASHLTEFYLWMSFGGVLGGLFAGLIAPHVFTRVLEYPILMMAVFLVRRDTWETLKSGDGRLLLAGLVLLLVVIGLAFQPVLQISETIRVALVTVLLIGIVLFNKTPLTQAALIAAGLVMVIGYDLKQDTVTRVRGFFGVNAILAREEGRFYVLAHGTTIHGAQDREEIAALDDGDWPDPRPYYHRKGAIATALNLARKQTGALPDVGVIGLGAGGMACLRHPGENWKFFEINPQVADLARNPAYFTYLTTCGGRDKIVMGDGRVQLSGESDASYDALVLDAFSSDAIPVHLLTREAMALYLSKLKPGGVMVFHISNRYMELASVVASVANTQGAITYVSRPGDELWSTDLESYRTESIVAIVGRTPDDLAAVSADDRWYQVARDTGTVPWTDDYSNVISAIYRKLRYGVLPREQGK